jgi:hypothetical protein
VQEECRKPQIRAKSLPPMRPILYLVDGDGFLVSLLVLSYHLESLISQQPKSLMDGRGGGTFLDEVTGSINELLHSHSSNSSHLTILESDIQFQLYYNRQGLLDHLRYRNTDAARRLDQFLGELATDDQQWCAIDTGTAPGSADEELKRCLGRHLHDPRTEKILLAGCHDGGYAMYLQALDLKPYLRLSRVITLVTCKSTHPSYLSLPFQIMRLDGLFETSTYYDRNPTLHPPLIKGYSGSSGKGASMFGYLTHAEEQDAELVLPAPDSFIFFVVYPTDIWRACRHSPTRSKSLGHDIWKRDGMPLIFQHISWPLGRASLQKGSVLAMEGLTNDEEEQARQPKDHGWLDKLIDSWTKV